MFLVIYRKVRSVFTLSKTIISDFWTQSALTHTAVYSIHCTPYMEQYTLSNVHFCLTLKTLFTCQQQLCGLLPQISQTSSLGCKRLPHSTASQKQTFHYITALLLAHQFGEVLLNSVLCRLVQCSLGMPQAKLMSILFNKLNARIL